jgi:uroporphyrinogen-III decarboxylase
VGDSAASLIGPKHYRVFALPYEQKICAAIHEAGARVKLHICGDITAILDLVLLSGADIIDVDWMVDFGRAVKTFSNRCSACGNFDPVNIMLRGTLETVRQAIRKCVAVASNNTFIAAGCEVPRETSIENMVVVDETLRELAL